MEVAEAMKEVAVDESEELVEAAADACLPWPMFNAVIEDYS